ncbi:MAG: hypothetical protein U0075_07290 [Thermomicrobiales bacterium]
MSGELIIALAITLIVLAVAGTLLTRRSRDQTPPPVAQSVPPPVVTPDRTPATSGIVAELNELQHTGQWDVILRRLDTQLPEWPVSSSLIEVARAVGNLDHDLALLPQDPVTSVVTRRLQAQTDAVAEHLWRLADQLVLATRMRSPALQQRLEQEDAVLLRLLPAIQSAQDELVQLTLGGDTSAALQRAEGRFLALGETARELQSLSG